MPLPVTLEFSTFNSEVIFFYVITVDFRRVWILFPWTTGRQRAVGAWHGTRIGKKGVASQRVSCCRAARLSSCEPASLAAAKAFCIGPMSRYSPSTGQGGLIRQA